MLRYLIRIGLLTMVALPESAWAREETAMDAFTVPKGQAQLFLDDHLVAECTNCNRRWHCLTKHPSNPLMLKSGPEECLYLFGTVMREPEQPGGEPVFRMWYYAVGQGTRWVAYARSRDGLQWEKPELGLVDIAGNKKHNAVFCPEGWLLLGLSGVIRDPTGPDAERYKLIIPAKTAEDGDKAYLLAASPDGLRWKLNGKFTPPSPCKPDRACFVWDPFRSVYAHYSRMKHAPQDLVERGGPAYWGRAIALCTSRDFDKWSEPVPVMHAEADDPDGTEIYGAAFFPYEGQWIALPQIHRSLPELAYIDVAVAHSRDGVNWRREKDLILPRGGKSEWDRFNQCASTRPVRVDDQLWVYYSGRLYRHGGYKRQTRLTDTGPYFVGIGLATLRLDGWCSLEAGFDGGTILTKPLRLPEGRPFVNAKAEWGEIVVEVLDSEGNPVEGMASKPVTGDGVRLKVEWPNGASLDSISGKPVRLRFHVKNALLYSWGVE